MREYELMAVYDLAVIEAGGQDASVEHLTGLVERNGGAVTKVDHWGRRRLAYRMNKQLDADFVVTRIELDPQAVAPLNADFEIEERVYRHLVVRADELPPPRPVLAPAGSRGPGSPTGPPPEAPPAPAPEAGATPAPEAGVTPAPEAEAAPAPEAEAAPAPEAEAAPAPEAEAAPAPEAEAAPAPEAEAAPAPEAEAAPAPEAEAAPAPEAEAAPAPEASVEESEPPAGEDTAKE